MPKRKHKGIFMRGNIYWICYAGIDGKIIRESTGSNKFDIAEGRLIDKKAEVRNGKNPYIKKIGNHIFAELATEYLVWAKRQRSYKQKKNVVDHLVKLFGTLPLRKFTTMLLEQYQGEMLDKGKKPATVNRHIATLKHMFTKAVDGDMVEEEILKRIRKAKQLKENNNRLRYLSKEECHALISSCDEHLKPIVITALNTGMRKGEILNLKWDNVDLRYGFILLDNTKNGERREIPINSTLRFVLQGISRRLDVPYVFHANSTGKAYGDVKKSFHSAMRKAGIKDFRFHDLRHTFASHLVMSAVDITTIKELLGHKDIKMTLRYAHLAPSHKVKAVDILDNALNKMRSAQLVHNLALGEQ